MIMTLQLSEYLIVETDYNKKDLQPEHTQQFLKEASDLVDMWPKLATRSVKRSDGSRHRTMIKKSRQGTHFKDFIAGDVQYITAFPLGDNEKLSRTAFGKLAADVLAKRTDLDYENFADFAQSVTSVAFVEHVLTPDGERNLFKCSCSSGIKGKDCLHVVALQMKAGDIEKPNNTLIASIAKSSGRPKKGAKQVRF